LSFEQQARTVLDCEAALDKALAERTQLRKDIGARAGSCNVPPSKIGYLVKGKEDAVSDAQGKLDEARQRLLACGQKEKARRDKELERCRASAPTFPDDGVTETLAALASAVIRHRELRAVTLAELPDCHGRESAAIGRLIAANRGAWMGALDGALKQWGKTDVRAYMDQRNRLDEARQAASFTPAEIADKELSRVAAQVRHDRQTANARAHGEID